MKKTLLIISTATFLASPVAFAGYLADGAANPANGVDDADDLQAVTINIPEVALLSVTDAATTLDLTSFSPTLAGNGFPGVDDVNSSSVSQAATAAGSFKLSSNVAAATSPTLRTIDVALATSNSLPSGSTLKIGMSGTGITAGSTKITGATPDATHAASAIGNTAFSNGVINYTFGATNSGGMIAYTNGETDIEVVFTLSDA